MYTKDWYGFEEKRAPPWGGTGALGELMEDFNSGTTDALLFPPAESPSGLIFLIILIILTKL